MTYHHLAERIVKNAEKEAYRTLTSSAEYHVLADLHNIGMAKKPPFEVVGAMDIEDYAEFVRDMNNWVRSLHVSPSTNLAGDL